MTGVIALLLCLTPLAFVVAVAAGSAISALGFRFLGTRLERLRPAARAHAYVTLRLGPALLASLFTGVLFLPAFLIFEPRDSGETVGPALLAVGVLAALPLARAVWRGWRSWRATRDVVRWWLRDADELDLPGSLPCPAWAVDASFPVVAVVGLREPFVMVSRPVLEACSPEELTAIVAHETAHLERRDNLTRLLFRTAPDLLSGTDVATALERGWEQASEEAADDAAGRGRALDLASALLKVARLAEDRPALRPAVATLCQGGNIARRVRRLTGELADENRGAGWEGISIAGLRPWAGLLPLASFLVVAALPGVLRHIHLVAEIVVGGLQ